MSNFYQQATEVLYEPTHAYPAHGRDDGGRASGDDAQTSKATATQAARAGGAERLEGVAPARLLRGQVLVHEAATYSAGYHGGHLVLRVRGAGVVPARTLGDVSLEVLRAHAVIRAVVAALEHGPMALDALCVRHAVHVLAHGVIDGLMVGEPLVAAVLVRVNLGSRLHLVKHELLEGQSVGALHHLGAHVVGVAVLHAHDGGLAHGSTACAKLLVAVLVLLLAAHVGLIDLDRAGEQAAFLLPCLPDPVRHEPCGFLANLQIPVQLHRGDALEVRDAEIDSVGPLLERHLGALEGGAGADGEEEVAGPAAVGHGLLTRNRRSVLAVAAGATATSGPAFGFKPVAGGLLIGEHLAQLYQADPHSERFTGCFLFHHVSKVA